LRATDFRLPADQDDVNDGRNGHEYSVPCSIPHGYPASRRCVIRTPDPESG
jgi:hypothetical protein